MREPLRSELGLLGTTEEAKQILEGTYQVPEPAWTSTPNSSSQRLQPQHIFHATIGVQSPSPTSLGIGKRLGNAPHHQYPADTLATTRQLRLALPLLNFMHYSHK
jgi:hypothetical protein